MLLFRNVHYVVVFRDTIKAIERAADVRQSYLVASRNSNTAEKKVVRSMPIELCFRGDSVGPTDAPLTFNNGVKPRLGDRVINLNAIGVPFGLKGTVVVLHSHTGYVEVLFDEEFVGGKSLNGFCSQFRGKLCPWSSLLRLAQREVGKRQSDAARGPRPVVPVVAHSGEVSASAAAASASKSALLKEFVKKPAENKPNNTDKKSAAADLLKKQIGAGAQKQNLPTPPAPAAGQVKILSRPAATAAQEAPIPPAPPPAAVPMQPNPIPESAASGRGFASLSAAASGNTVAVEPDATAPAEEEAEAAVGGKVVVTQGLGAGVDLTTRTDVAVLRGPEVEKKTHPKPAQKPTPKQNYDGTKQKSEKPTPKQNYDGTKQKSEKPAAKARPLPATDKPAAKAANTKSTALLGALKPAAGSKTDAVAPVETPCTAAEPTKPKKSNLLKNAKKALKAAAGGESTSTTGAPSNAPVVATAASTEGKEKGLLSMLKSDTGESKQIAEVQITPAPSANPAPAPEAPAEKPVKRIVPTSVLLKKKA